MSEVSTALRCFDRKPGELMSRHYLKTYQEALAQYHPYLKARFHNGDY
jgi:hypothetical protein